MTKRTSKEAYKNAIATEAGKAAATKDLEVSVSLLHDDTGAEAVRWHASVAASASVTVIDDATRERFVSAYVDAIFVARENKPERVAARRLERLRRICEQQVENTKGDLVKFTENLEKNAHYAFNWCDGVMESVAKARIAARMLELLDNGLGLEDLHRDALQLALHAALYPKRSTSAITNFMEQCDGAAAADMERRLRDALGK